MRRAIDVGKRSGCPRLAGAAPDTGDGAPSVRTPAETDGALGQLEHLRREGLVSEQEYQEQRRSLKRPASAHSGD